VRRCGNVVVGDRRALVAGSNENGYAFGERLLIQTVNERITRRPEIGLRVAIADAHNARGRYARIQNVLKRNKTTKVDSIRTRSQDYARARRSGACPLRVQYRFYFISVDAGIAAVVGAAQWRGMSLRERSRCVAGKPECRSKAAPVPHAVHVAVFHHYDGLSLPRNAPRKNRIEVVDRGKICGHNSITAVANRIAGARMA